MYRLKASYFYGRACHSDSNLFSQQRAVRRISLASVSRAGEAPIRHYAG